MSAEPTLSQWKRLFKRIESREKRLTDMEFYWLAVGFQNGAGLFDPDSWRLWKEMMIDMDAYTAKTEADKEVK